MSRPRSHDGVVAERRRLTAGDTKPLYLRIDVARYGELCRLAGVRSLAATVERLVAEEMARRKTQTA